MVWKWFGNGFKGVFEISVQKSYEKVNKNVMKKFDTSFCC
jgi:hypothetical protein